MTPVRILHAHSTFTLGGKEARAVRLMNAFGDTARHTILSAVPGALAARAAIAPGIVVDFPDDAPSLAGKPAPGRYWRLARYMAGFDLVLTYNWGAMDAVMAHRLLGAAMRLPPLIHHEDGFNADEAVRQKPKRIAFRRLGLPTAHRVVVPSERLERVAREVWRQPPGRIARIANGVPVAGAAAPPRADAIPGFARRPGEVVVGTLAGLRAVKNLPRLVRAFAAATPAMPPARLVIAGEGPERDAILAEAARCGVADRLVLPGFLPDPQGCVGLFDIFALSSDSEQFPISLIEAMAAGLPAVSTDVGDVAAMVSAENRPFVAADERGLGGALARLLGDAALRQAVGAANRAKALACFDEERMIADYRALYAGALGRPAALG
ncbi:glycosyltransferase family 4 protein [Sphingomonas solaris]|uniref:Glycosyltransferase family 4 protein n=1 Tax=Alterirhizorhabdus solaris TaxID=2529389 RepID=A0A558QZ96_9SPHN|nr:glycosyltransferase family 4 protein [Sphingomonas solaris]TVV72486.1 glycosyltransferase family 4 protein [Sphingomonas solaris]